MISERGGFSRRPVVGCHRGDTIGGKAWARGLLALALLTALAACSGAASPAARAVAEGPLWCYKTLGDPICYVSPEPDIAARTRLIGTYPLQPAS